MEPLQQLRAKIAEFPGYDGDLERRRSDEYVRSYLGEALAGLAARSPLAPALRERIDDLILRVGFADPRSFAARPVVATKQAPAREEAVADADVATVALADRAGSVDAISAAQYVDDVTAMLDRRDAAMRAASLTNP